MNSPSSASTSSSGRGKSADARQGRGGEEEEDATEAAPKRALSQSDTTRGEDDEEAASLRTATGRREWRVCCCRCFRVSFLLVKRTRLSWKPTPIGMRKRKENSTVFLFPSRVPLLLLSLALSPLRRRRGASGTRPRRRRRGAHGTRARASSRPRPKTQKWRWRGAAASFSSRLCLRLCSKSRAAGAMATPWRALSLLSRDRQKKERAKVVAPRARLAKLKNGKANFVYVFFSLFPVFCHFS